MPYKLILGSSSPSRAQILKNAQLKFTTLSPDIDETPFPNENPKDHVERLAVEKAQAVLEQLKNTSDFKKELTYIIISSDQIALIDSKIIGKPHTLQRAKEILLNCSGQMVRYHNGLSIIIFNQKLNQTEQTSTRVYTDVYFKTLTPAKIDQYLSIEQPLKCAGALRSEGVGSVLVNKITSDDPNTLIGLPLLTVIKLIEQMGINPLDLDYI